MGSRAAVRVTRGGRRMRGASLAMTFARPAALAALFCGSGGDLENAVTCVPESLVPLSSAPVGQGGSSLHPGVLLFTPRRVQQWAWLFLFSLFCLTASLL